MFLIPFGVSLAFSLSTVGTSVGWQDSGFFLSAVKEMGVLHPPGFVLYLLLCKAWTILLSFLDFTLAVHLFSSACAAAAAGTIAITARELLRSRGPIFQVAGDDTRVDVPAIAAGCLAASGYTFWASGIAAKGYALFYLILALLLWRMIRADETRGLGDFTIVAVLIGLSWAAHPSATNMGLALLLYVAFHARSIGWKGVAGRTALAAACAVGPSLLLPILAARETVTKFGEPTSLGEFVRYLLGARFTGRSGAFGPAETRWEGACLFFWEEFLAVGLIAVAVGLARLALSNRRLLAGVAAWIVPAGLVAVIFKLEGQLDLWLVAAWIPLHLIVAVGFHELARRTNSRAVAGVAAIGIVWAAAVNGPLLVERGNNLPAAMGQLFLKKVEKDAVVVLDSDDALATATWLQVVKGERPDVRIVSAARERAFPGRPLYYENPPAGRDLKLVPAGALQKVAEKIDPAEWELPVELSRVYARPRRARGQFVDLQTMTVEPERYERRLMIALVRAQRELALWHLGSRTPEGIRTGVEILESIYAADPESRQRLGVVYPLGAAQLAAGNLDRAEPLLRLSLELLPPPRIEAAACHFLSILLEKRGRRVEAEQYRTRARLILRNDPSLASEFDRYASPK